MLFYIRLEILDKVDTIVSDTDDVIPHVASVKKTQLFFSYWLYFLTCK